VVELKPERARYLAERLSRATVIGGDALDPEIFIEINIGLAQAVIAVSNDDEVNILAALLAKRAGCPTAISLVNNPNYGPLMGSLGVDVTVSPRESTVSTILQRIRRGRILAVHSICDGAAEIIEAEALGTSPMVGRPLVEIKLPTGIIVGAILRGDAVIIPRPQTAIQEHDRIVILAAARAVKKIEQMFAVSLEFF
jgi:trk system potassium uptake protein TrkA